MTRAALEAERDTLNYRIKTGLYGRRWTLAANQRIAEIDRELGKMSLQHDSDCAVHNEPAYPKGPCNCRLSIRVGDEVTVRAKVTSVNGDYIGMNISGCDVVLPASCIISHTPAPRPLKVGDRVRDMGAGIPYIILAIDGDDCWIKQDQTGGRATMPRRVLTRVEGE
jgi:hypothetical protein